MHIDIICHCSLYSILSHCFDNLDVLTSPFSLQNLQYIDNSEFPRLADLGAVISGAKNLQCQQVLEELDVCWNWHILVLVTDLEESGLKTEYILETFPNRCLYIAKDVNVQNLLLFSIHKTCAFKSLNLRLLHPNCFCNSMLFAHSGV